MNQVLREHIFPSGQRLQLVQGDITLEAVDAIVNAANSLLQHGGGVAAAIARKGGPQVQAESDAWVLQHGPVSHAEPAITSGGRLPCKYVIHAVGPVWGEGDEDARLHLAVQGSLKRAEELDLTSIALPAISTGIYGFPKERAAGVMIRSILEHLAQNPASSLTHVRLTLYDRPTLVAFLQEWKAIGMESDQTEPRA
jgi:O-acetyl-ADP-ribose deacetylase (regulator of RNase III)